MKNKALVILLSAALLFPAAGCSGGDAAAPKSSGPESARQEETQADGAGKKELTVWCWTQDFNLYAIREANKIYSADHPDVNVTPIEVPWEDVQSKLITSLTAKQYDALPDMVLMQDNAVQKNIMTYPDAFLDLTGRMDFSNFSSYKVGSLTVDGHIYGVPFDSGVCCTFLRRDVIEQAGYKVEDFNDVTWDQFIEMGVKVKEATGMPILSGQQGDLAQITMMLQSCGEWYFNEDGSIHIADNAALKAAIELLGRMEKAGVMKSVVDWNEYTQTLVNGDVAGCANAIWMVSVIGGAADQSGKWGVANFPRLEGFPNAKNSSSNGGSSWLILSSSPNADAAVDFMDKTFNGSVKFYDTILERSGAVATWLPAAESEAYRKPVEFFGGQTIYSDVVGWSGNVPPVTTGLYIYEAQDAVTKAYQEILNGADVDTSLQNAEETIRFLMQ